MKYFIPEKGGLATESFNVILLLKILFRVTNNQTISGKCRLYVSNDKGLS